MTGWGQDGPYAQMAGHDINYIALAGALHAVGTPETPVPPLNLVGDYGGGGMLLAVGLLSAILECPRVGRRPGRRRRDVRRRRHAHDGVLRPVRRRAVGGPPARERDRRRCALLPHLRDRRREALRRRCDGTAVLRGAVRAPRRRRAAGGHARGVGGARRHDGGAVPGEDARRVGGRAGHAAVVRVTGARTRGGTGPSAQPGARHVRHGGRGGATGAGTAVLAYRVAPLPSPPSLPGDHTLDVLTELGLEHADWVDAGIARQSAAPGGAPPE